MKQYYISIRYLMAKDALSLIGAMREYNRIQEERQNNAR